MEDRAGFLHLATLHIFAGESPGQAGIIHSQSDREAGAHILADAYSQRERDSIDRLARLHDAVALGAGRQSHHVPVECELRVIAAERALGIDFERTMAADLPVIRKYVNIPSVADNLAHAASLRPFLDRLHVLLALLFADRQL